MFQTYGDGLTQHAPSTPALKEDMADYLASLASWLVNNPGDIEEVRRFYDPIQRRKVLFAATIKHKDKRQWYSMVEEKVSSADSRRHDRRWNEVPDWANGSAEAIFRLCLADHWGTLERYQAALQIESMAHDGSLDCWCPYDFAKKMIGYEGESTALKHAYGACRNLAESVACRRQADSCLQSYIEQTVKAEEVASA
jgi:hypothetical protein